MPFRIAIGSMSVNTINDSDKIGQKIKDLIFSKTIFLKNKNFELLREFSEYSVVELEIEKKTVEISYFRKIIDGDNILIVIRAAYPSFNFPTYYSLSFIGRVYVEGFVINSKNECLIPDDKSLWSFK